jgi:hypothetical protein
MTPYSALRKKRLELFFPSFIQRMWTGDALSHARGRPAQLLSDGARVPRAEEWFAPYEPLERHTHASRHGGKSLCSVLHSSGTDRSTR